MLDLSAGAVGGVLAAIGTALPETIIPLVAIVLAGDATGPSSVSGDEIGVGAILGAPFMLSTLSLFATGVALIAYRHRRRTGTQMLVDSAAMALNIRFFAAAYAIAIGAALVPADLALLRYAAVAAVLFLYVVYVRRQLRTESDDAGEELPPLRLSVAARSIARGEGAGDPRAATVLLQIVVGAAFIVLGAVVFVDAVRQISLGLGLPPALLALLIAPAATELPETVNSVIWVRQGKDTLALGNITGSMVFQATFPTAIGILLAASSWALAPHNTLGFVSAAIAFASIGLIYGVMGRRGTLHARHLLVGGAFYLAYVALILFSQLT